MIMKPFLLCILLVYFGKSAGRHEKDSSPSKADIQDYEEFLHKVVECKKVTSGAVTMVKDNKILLSRGFGFVDDEKKKPATRKTKFCIGSLTKAFTSTMIAKFLSEYKSATWDTPIKDILGESFRLSDQLLTDNVNLRDLLAHKVGYPSNFNALLVGFAENTTREELVRSLQFQKGIRPFRTEFLYNNYMYALAGHVMEKVTGYTWEQLVSDYLMTPINMSSSGFVTDVKNFESFSPSFIYINNKSHALDQDLVYSVSPCGPAGSIYTNADDMGKWILFNLNDGSVTNGTTLVPQEFLSETHKSQMATPFLNSNLYKPVHPIDDVGVSYDMGWMTSIYRGYRKIWHSGGIVGYSSLLWLFPDLNAGVFVTITGSKDNRNGNPIYAIMSAAADLLLGESRWLNDSTACSYPAPWKDKKPVTYANEGDIPDSYWNVSIAMSNYTGIYSHPAFGDIIVNIENETDLLLYFGRFGKMKLFPVTNANFHAYFEGRLSFMTHSDDNTAPFPVSFVISKHSNVDIVQFPIDMHAGKTDFVRKSHPQRVVYSPAHLSTKPFNASPKSVPITMFLLLANFLFYTIIKVIIKL